MLKSGNQKWATMGTEVIIREGEIGNLNKMKKKWSIGSKKIQTGWAWEMKGLGRLCRNKRGMWSGMESIIF